MFVKASVLTALFAGVSSLCKLRPLLALPEPKDNLLLSLSEGEVTGACDGAGSTGNLREGYASCRSVVNLLRSAKRG